MSHEVPHTAQPLHLQPSKRVPSPANPRQQLFDSYEQCREQEEAVQKAKSKNAELPGQLWTQEETSQERDSELRDKNKSLERELQSSEKNRKKLGQQLILLRSEHESILQENGKLREQNKSLSQDNRKVFNNNASLVDRLETLEPEVDTLRKAVACLEREKALMKEDYLGRCKKQTMEQLQLRSEVKQLTWEKEQSSLFKQKLEAVEKNAKQLAEGVDSLQHEVDSRKHEVDKLQQELNEKKEKLNTTQRRNQLLQSELHKLQDSSHPCPKQTCMETRAQRDQLAGNLTRRCERPECVSASADLEDVKKKISQMRKRRCNYEHCKNEQLKDMNELQQDLHRPCQRHACMETRTERDQLAKTLKRKCERQECVSASADLEDVKKKISQMKKRQCNSDRCKNEQLKDMNETIGSKIRIDGREYSHSEALQQLVERQHPGQSEEVKSLQSRLQRMQVENQEFQSHLQRMQVEKQELQEKLDTAMGRNAAGRCTRSDCQRIEERLKRMQSEHTQGQSAAKDMTIMRGGEYDEPLEEFNEVFTNPDELLGVLERCVEPFEAKKMLCKIFQRAYDLCKTAALTRTRQTLDDLFTVSEDKSRKAVLGEISRAYGLLLHVSGLKNDEATCRDICSRIVKQLTSDKVSEAYNTVGRILQAEEEYLLKCVQVAWKFVTLPSPIIVSQPEVYNPQIVEREYGYWDENTPDAVLIYTRPVVYRCYDGNRAEKGMVANTDKCSKPAGQNKGPIQKVLDYLSGTEV